MSSMATTANKCLISWILCGCVSLFWAACGRTELLPPACSIDVTPAGLDFAEVAPGDSATLSVIVAAHGPTGCLISSVGIGPGSDSAFALDPATLPSLAVQPGQHASIAVTFSPTSASVPLQRAGTLALQTDDPLRPRVDVPLAGRIHTNCKLAVSPPAVDFGHVHIDTTATASVNLVNTGTSSCDVAGIAIGQGSDPQFALGAGQADHFSLAPGADQSIALTFHPTDLATPHHRSGQLVLQSTDSKQATLTIPLSADIDIGCSLTVAPDQLDFGKVILNNTASRTVTLVNNGSDPCQVSGLGFSPTSHPDFTLDAGQARAFAVAPGSTQTITVTFGAFNSAPPHLQTGMLVMQTGDLRAPTASVALSATVSSPCLEASQWIYTVDSDGRFSRFDPATLTFTDISKKLNCPNEYRDPFSMAVDQNAAAWVVYGDGNLFKVDTATGRCEATSFQADQPGFAMFGMGFVFDPATGIDTLYIAGTDSLADRQSSLATISFPSLKLTPVGLVAAGNAELTGTGDGGLWAFVPSDENPDGKAVLVRLDPASGKTLETYEYPTLSDVYGSWAVKFWGGSFWIFLAGAVYEVPRATPQTIRIAMPDTGGRDVVGAGVSTCAPLF
jgi:hypothetical protein